MTEKEVAELRRRFKPEKSNINRVRGCYVNEKKEIISEFDQSLGMMSEDDSAEVLKVFKKTLSGALGRNLLDIEFTTEQVTDGSEQRLLADLKAEKLSNEEKVHTLYDKIISTLELDSSYLILLAYDSYDVFNTSADGQKETESTSVFNYILCSVCPVRTGKATLSYYFPGKCFRAVAADTVLGAPEIGFMYPAFDDRTANIYGSLYYTKRLNDSHTDTVDALFRAPLPMPAAVQKQTFSQILSEAVAEDCSMRVVRTVHSQMCGVIEEAKADKQQTPPSLSKGDVSEMLRYSGVSDEKVEKFEQKFDEAFGKDTEINPKNIADAKALTVKTDSARVKISSEGASALEARIIDGVKYILIRADGEVEVNGVIINI